MALEVEVKVRVDCGMLDAVKRRAESLGFKCGTPSLETDTYYSHPCRDFLESDEALRLRIAGPEAKEAKITYKGPRRVESGVKSREEIEVTVHDAQAMDVILERLGFRRVVEVRKERVYCRSDTGASVTLDKVERLGCFVEVEAGSRGEVERLLGKLGLEGMERVVRTYAEMMLDLTR